MYLSDEEKETADNYVLDVTNTFVANFFIIFGFIVAVMYFIIFNRLMNSFTLPEMQLIALLGFAYSVIRIIYALTDNITIQYMQRIKPEVKEDVKTNE